MPITGGELQAGDILFKHAPDKAVAKIILAKQRGIQKRLARSAGIVGSAQAARCTHVALAADAHDVLEFDEGGSGIKLLGRGYGFVRGNMRAGARMGNTYDVFSCTNAHLGQAAADRAKFIWDLTHQSQRLKGSYGLGKLIRQLAKNPSKGKAYNTAALETRLEDWLTKKRSIKFICSEFATFCYLWGAEELGGVNLTNVFGIDRARLSPVELYVRCETQGYFAFKGTLYA